MLYKNILFCCMIGMFSVYAMDDDCKKSGGKKEVPQGYVDENNCPVLPGGPGIARFLLKKYQVPFSQRQSEEKKATCRGHMGF